MKKTITYSYTIGYKTSLEAMTTTLTLSAVNEEQAFNSARKEIEMAYGPEIAHYSTINIISKKRN